MDLDEVKWSVFYAELGATVYNTKLSIVVSLIVIISVIDCMERLVPKVDMVMSNYFEFR